MDHAAKRAVDITAGIKVPRRQKKSIAPLVIDTLVILMSCLGSVFSFYSCFELPVPKTAVILSAVIACVLSSFIFNMKQGIGGKVSLGTAVLFLFVTWIMRNDICAGLANILNIYLARVKKIFREKPFLEIAEPELAARHMTICFCFVTVIICITAAYCASRGWHAIGLCIPPLILPITVFMFGLEPNTFAFTAVVSGCAASIAYEIASSEKIGSGKQKYAASYNSLTAAAVTAVCFLITAAAVRISDYQRPERINNIYNNVTGYIERGEMQNVLEEVITFVAGESGRTGAIDHGRLGEMGEIYFNGRPVLRVTIGKPEDTLYLRGFVGSVYTGRSWEPLPSSRQRELEEITSSFDNEGLSSMFLDGYSLKNSGTVMPKYSFSVQNISAGREHIYMPYYLVPESVSSYAEETENGFAGGETSYTGQYYDPSGYYGFKGIFRLRWNISQTMRSDEAAYRNFVYENYLELPEEHERLDAIFGDSYYDYITGEEILTGKSTLDEMTVFSRKLYYIKSWLRNNCEYSLNAGRLPPKRDFVDRFLETRQGSCSHFASTAVMMCRYAGIPARYVEGYIIKPSSDFSASASVGDVETIELTDARAHAWAEIYIDGYGWYPMEFTSGYGNVRTALPTETIPAETEETSETTVISEEEISETSPESQSQSQGAGGTRRPSAAAADASEDSPSEDPSPAETTTFSPEGETGLPGAENDGRPTVGFGIFGIRGSGKVDVYYDLTGEFLCVLGIAAIPAVFILRRKICLYVYRKKCRSGKKNAAITAYRKFLRIVKIMKLPVQGKMTDLEYAEVLSGSSPLLSDGTAETVINVALKASFGGDILTSEDSKESVFALNNFIKRYYASLSKFGKFKAKYIYCII